METPGESRETVKMLKRGGAQIGAYGKMVNLASKINGKFRRKWKTVNPTGGNGKMLKRTGPKIDAAGKW